jgi:exopolyphosphatase/guanosine-5'-triphosphate,3'-diphosphate pyrophosphatase
MRAVIDIGTNTVLLLVGERDEAGQVYVVADEARICRLGKGVAASGKLDPAAIARTLEVLHEYAAIARSHDAEIVAVATEACAWPSMPMRSSALLRSHSVHPSA